MGRFILATTSCFCAVIIDSQANGLPLMDSDKLPATNIQVLSVVIDGVSYPVGITFPFVEDFLDYLNVVLNETAELAGIWQNDNGIIRYTNPENFNQAEVMAILSTQRTILRVGNPPYTLHAGITPLNYANANVFSIPQLAGRTLLAVHLGQEFQMPSPGYGYSYNGGTVNPDGSVASPAVLDLSGSGQTVEDIYIDIIHTQSATL